jgi:hypothetical protein
VPHGYRVVALFDGPGGAVEASPGVTCLVTPVPPPGPVTDLQVTLHEDRFEAAWTPPPAGLVQLYRLTAPAAFAAGEVIPPVALPALGPPLAHTGRQARGGRDGQTVLHLLPVTVAGSVVVAGQGVSRAWIPEVTDLTAQRHGDGLLLRWSWPPGITAARVVARADGFATAPAAADALADQVCTQAEYHRQGHCRVPLPAEGAVFVTVFSAVNQGGQWAYAAGVAPGCRRQLALRAALRALYWVAAVRRWLFFPTGEAALTVLAENPGALPPLQLVGKPAGWPLRPDDGEVLARTPADPLAGPLRPVRVKFRPPWRVSARNVRLFPCHADDLDWLELRAADAW